MAESQYQVGRSNRRSTPGSTRWKMGRVAVLSIILLAGILALVEAVAFVSRSEEGARERASAEFQRLCEKRCGSVGLTSRDFSGPEISAKTSRAYSFLWQARRGDVEILVTVSYGPRWTESWFMKR